MAASIDSLTADFHGLRARLGPPGFNVTTIRVQPPQTTSIKLDIPRFDGSDPLGWIFKINQFFDYHLTPNDQRLRIASLYMEGEALTWFQWMHQNGQLMNWATFLHALEIRFAPSQYEDPKGALFKLTQTSTVKEYEAQFETFANRIVGLPPSCYLSCFISGLKPAVRREVLAFQPATLTQAISLAKLQEEKLPDLPNRSSFSPKSHAPASSSNPPSFKPTMSVTPPKPQTPIKRLSPEELQARRDKGLCYNCEERYQRGHRCKRLFNLLIVTPDRRMLLPWVFRVRNPTQLKLLAPNPTLDLTRPKSVFMLSWVTQSHKLCESRVKLTTTRLPS
jgi:hypothetical protein